MGPRAISAQEVEKRIGYRFRSPELLEAALTHRSFAHEAGTDSEDRIVHYERLEFLGDALLGFEVARSLYRGDPSADEGVLTRRKQMVVSSRTLAGVSSSLGLGRAMLLGRGEQLTGGRAKHSLLADVFEAVLGAVYLDGGIRAARAFVRRHLGEAIRTAAAAREVVEDYKTRLQERVQSRLHLTPVYRIVSSSGPDHRQKFRAVVEIGGEQAGSGEGTSRKRAEQEAALDALNRGEQED